MKIKPMNKEYIEDRKIKIIDPSKVDINWYKYKIDQIFNKTMQFYRWLDSRDYLTKKRLISYYERANYLFYYGIYQHLNAQEI